MANTGIVALHRPEIGEPTRCEQVFRQAENFSPQAWVGLLKTHGNRRQWQPGLKDDEVLEELKGTAAQCKGREDVLVRVL